MIEDKREIDNKSRKSVTILGVRIDCTRESLVLTAVQKAISANKKITIVTPNPEIVLRAYHDQNLTNALNSATISVPDGVGLLFAQRLLGYPTDCTLTLIKGRELFLELIAQADKNKWRVVLLGDSLGSAKTAMNVLAKQYKHVKLFALDGPNFAEDATPKTPKDKERELQMISEIQKIHPRIIFIGFGSPRQEKWMSKWLDKVSCNIMMVVGGTFDVISSKFPAPPSFWPRSLEWLWRLLTKPDHWLRVFKSVIVFPSLFLFTYCTKSKTVLIIITISNLWQ